MRKIGRGIAAALAIFSISLVWADSPEVRVLIDVSGSMKKNDPANLRVPALRLLTELLPEDATAGVWMFAQEPAALIATAEADGRWKGRAAQAAERVHSRGLLTDIEAALSAATRDWQAAGPEQHRHIILLTDGVVDTSADAGVSVASRERILADQVPRLQELQARVHTIALSDEADHELLEALAEGTDGWYESVSTARDLQRTFLRMFEQAAPRESLPLDGNKFTVDSSISELTVLAFSSKPDNPVRLGPPGGGVTSLTDHPDNMRWRREAGYELITISQPATGEWQLHADSDPDNRVLIVTDLKLLVDDIPTNMLHGETSAVVASFADGETPIERPEFLELAKLTLTWSAPENEGDNGKARLSFETESSKFVGVIGDDLVPGRYLVTVRADADTFSREKRFSLETHRNPLRLEIAEPRTAKNAGSVALITNPEVLPINRVLALAEIESADGTARVHPATENPRDRDSLLFALDSRTAGMQIVTVTASMRSASGRMQTIKLPSLALEGPGDETASADETEVPAMDGSTPAAVEQGGPGFDYLLAGMVIGGSNLGFFGVMMGGRLLYRKPKQITADTDPLELFDADPDDT